MADNNSCPQLVSCLCGPTEVVLPTIFIAGPHTYSTQSNYKYGNHHLEPKKLNPRDDTNQSDLNLFPLSPFSLWVQSWDYSAYYTTRNNPNKFPTNSIERGRKQAGKRGKMRYQAAAWPEALVIPYHTAITFYMMTHSVSYCLLRTPIMIQYVCLVSNTSLGLSSVCVNSYARGIYPWSVIKP